MLTQFSSQSIRWLAAGFVLAAVPALAAEPEGVVRLGGNQPAGVVRISDDSPITVVRGQSGCNQIGTCPHGVSYGKACNACQTAYVGAYGQGGAPVGYGYGETYGYGPHDCRNNSSHIPSAWDLHPMITNCALLDWMHQVGNVYGTQIKTHAEQECQEKSAWLRCKFGYFCPTGNCGTGTPLFGHYSMVYPVDPQYFDQRDGQVYAAQGHNGPVAVPLAPNVNHTFNYGWGIPSSRLTPVSHPTYPPRP